jgi:hypothetical protein
MTPNMATRRGPGQADHDAPGTKHQNHTAIDLEALARQVAPLVVAQIATALGAVQAPYSTRKGHEPAEFIGRSKKWKATAPTIPGSVQMGRWVTVPRAAYAAWIAAQGITPSTSPAPSNDTSTATWSPTAALESVGLRRTR